MSLSPTTPPRKHSESYTQQNQPEFPPSDIDERASQVVATALARIMTPEKSSASTMQSLSSSFLTPPGANKRTVNPGSVKKRRRAISDPFGSPLPTTLADNFQPSFYPFSTNKSYKIGEKEHTIIKQKSTKDCGVAALLMLFTDIIRTGTELSPEEDFWDWATNVSLANGAILQREARKVGVKLISESLNTKDRLEILQKRLSDSGHPLITAITHPQICGHWIVLDKIDETHAFIRDPYTGDAYRIPKKTMAEYTAPDDDAPQSILSYGGKTQSSNTSP